MKTKKLTPRNAAPVKRENVATVSRDGNAIAPQIESWIGPVDICTREGCGRVETGIPFAGDDAE